MRSLKLWYNNFLKKMEKANKESFGDKKLGCCGLNSKQQKNKVNTNPKV
ncbi:hypothetical protein LGK95_18930 [Clostridium algoriphilum]|nr:LDCC motif putative metal-binding protein [Clostridium algoriphilum]MCB2295556.1 hypothetical protein [Clostridium algoriphilum]